MKHTLVTINLVVLAVLATVFISKQEPVRAQVVAGSFGITLDQVPLASIYINGALSASAVVGRPLSILVRPGDLFRIEFLNAPFGTVNLRFALIDAAAL